MKIVVFYCLEQTYAGFFVYRYIVFFLSIRFAFSFFEKEKIIRLARFELHYPCLSLFFVHQ